MHLTPTGLPVAVQRCRRWTASSPGTTSQQDLTHLQQKQVVRRGCCPRPALTGLASPGSRQPAPVTHVSCSIRTGHSYQLENQRRRKLPSTDEGPRLAAGSSSCCGHVPANCASSPARAERTPSAGLPFTLCALPRAPLTVIHVEHLLAVVLALPVLPGGADEGLLPSPPCHRGLPAALAVLHGAALLHPLRTAPSPERPPNHGDGVPRPPRALLHLQGHSPRQGESLW